MMKPLNLIEKYKYPVAIILGCFILAISFYSVQVNKQNSIERQKDQEMRAEAQKLEFEKRKYNDEKEAIEEKRIALEYCIMDADDDYWDYVRINMTEKDDGKYWGPQWKWDEADKKKKTKEDSCYKQYK